MTPDQFLLLADPLPEPMFLVSGDGMVLAGNRAVGERFGIAATELRGGRLAEIAVDEHDSLARYLQLCSRSRSVVLGAVALRGKDGGAVPRRAEGALVRPRSGDSPALILLRLIPKESAVGRFVALNQRMDALGKEMQRRKQAEEAAREQQERLHVTLQSIGDAVVVTAADGRIASMNPVAEQLTGWRQFEAIDRPLDEVFRIVNETSRRTVENPAVRALREGAIVGLANHTLLIAKDGVERPIDDSAAPIRDAQGRLVGVVLVFRDISTRRQAEEVLRASEGRFRQLADAMPQIVWAARPDGHIDYYNERWYEFTGFPRDEYGQASWAPILHPDDLQHCIDVYYGCVQAGTPYQIEYRFKDRRTGGYRWFLGRAEPVRNGDGKIVRWFGSCTDIDDTKRAEETSRFLSDAGAALAELNDPESTLQRIAAIAVPNFADWCVVDLVEGEDRRRRLATQHVDAEKVHLLQELRRRHPYRLDDPHGVGFVIRTGKPELVGEIDDATLAEVAHDAEHLLALRSLGLRSYIAVPMPSRGRVLGVLSFATAESSRRFTAGDLRVAEELASRAAVAVENAELYRALREADRRKDEFLATLAHELRNPLAPLRNGLQLMKLSSDRDVVERSRGMMERQLGQMVRLIDDLLDVSRISRGKLSLHKQRLELTGVVRAAIETCEPVFQQAGHKVAATLPPQPIYVDADETRLSQTLCNLLNNAAKFTEPAGSITIVLEQEGNAAVVRVRDSGIGIPPQMLERIFEMFSQVDDSLERTKGGLGIGLTLAKRLVEMHGGSIEARSEGTGKGSEFAIRLPTAAPPAAESETKGEADVKAASHRILVADDNRDAADSLAMMLSMMGHEVRKAYDGQQALAAAADYRPEAILLDIGMPLLNGYEVCRRIREQPWGKDALLIALTGWGQEEDRRRSKDASFDHHLVKPADPAMLRKLLGEL